MKSVTVAGIDCGTNSIRLKVSRVSEDGVEDIVPRILRVIRLGQDVDKTHRFADEALERAYAAAREFAEVLKKQVRVPKGKGHIEIRCPKCGTKFIKNT